jgi:hypothetical protein
METRIWSAGSPSKGHGLSPCHFAFYRPPPPQPRVFFRKKPPGTTLPSSPPSVPSRSTTICFPARPAAMHRFLRAPPFIVAAGSHCRMDLPGPTTSVGTRTDYSVGPWDYPACATRHLIAWSTRTTEEKYSVRKLYMSRTVWKTPRRTRLVLSPYSDL